MESNYSYNVSLLAREDIFNAEDYILNILHNKDASINLANKIEDAINKICKNPFFYNDCKYYGIYDESNRYIKVNNYNLFYYADKDKNNITILRFLYSKMNIKDEDINNDAI